MKSGINGTRVIVYRNANHTKEMSGAQMCPGSLSLHDLTMLPPLGNHLKMLETIRQLEFFGYNFHDSEETEFSSLLEQSMLSVFDLLNDFLCIDTI